MTMFTKIIHLERHAISQDWSQIKKKPSNIVHSPQTRAIQYDTIRKVYSALKSQQTVKLIYYDEPKTEKSAKRKYNKQ